MACSGGSRAGGGRAWRQRAGFGRHLLGEGGQDPGLVFGLGGQHGGGAGGLQVEHRPQLGEDVDPVQAQGVLVPARAQDGGELPVAGPVHLLHPAAQPAIALARSSPASFHQRRTGAGAADGAAPRPRQRRFAGQRGECVEAQGGQLRERAAVCRPGGRRASDRRRGRRAGRASRPSRRSAMVQSHGTPGRPAGSSGTGPAQPRRTAARAARRCRDAAGGECGGRRGRRGLCQARGRRPMTGAQPPRMTSARPAGSWRIMSGSATSCQVR